MLPLVDLMLKCGEVSQCQSGKILRKLPNNIVIYLYSGYPKKQYSYLLENLYAFWVRGKSVEREENCVIEAEVHLGPSEWESTCSLP